jgi:capsule biosynthesis phosphatase
MIKDRNVIVVDVDGTIAVGHEKESMYGSEKASIAMCLKLREFKQKGYWIILFTSRNMRTHDGNLGKIIKHTAPTLIRWLEEHDIPYDELHFGKPWCGYDGFYIDDRAIRPREFLQYSTDELNALIEQDRVL